MSEMGDGNNNEAIYVNWCVQMLRSLRPDGVLMVKDPCPFSSVVLRLLMTHLSQHPTYQGQTVISTGDDGITLRMRHGQIRREETK